MNKFKCFYMSGFLFFYLAGFYFLYESLNFILENKKIFYEYEWLNIMSVSFKFYIYLDWICLMFLSGVSVISGSILSYSCYYMKEEKNYCRFLVLMLLFIFSMWMMILSPNIVTILLGWDGLGLSSYLLVVYYQSDSSGSSGMLTILSNRIGDVCLLMSVWFLLKESNFGFFFCDKLGLFVSFFCLLAAYTKSAQAPFSVWLPAAMAAPTPVSSLVHSSTLVTAGVYLMMRVFSLLEWEVVLVGVFLCFFTNLMSGFMTMSEKDFKKLIALSTLSQVSLMMVSVMSGLVDLAFFHLIMHAFFKSVMFMGTGYVIHSSRGSQDMRNFSSLALSSPMLLVGMYITNLALMGFPFMCGFFSKDLLLEGLFSLSKSAVLAWAMVFSIFFTIYYSSLILKVLSGARSVKKSLFTCGDADIFVFMGICLLSVASCVFGYLFFWLFLFESQIIVFFSFEKLFIIMSLMVSSIMVSHWGASKIVSMSRLFMYSLFYSFFCSSKVLFYLKFMNFKYNKNSFQLSDSGWSESLESVWSRLKMKALSCYLQIGLSSHTKVGIFFSFVSMSIFLYFFYFF